MERRTMLFSLLILATFAFFDGVRSNSGGPPIGQIPIEENFNRICVNMEPNHGATPQTGNGGFVIGTDLPLTEGSYSYTAGQTYRVNLTNTGTSTFRGFLVIAHVPGQNQMLIGRFLPQGNNQQTIDCDATGTSDEATITHSNSGRTNFTDMEFMWEAPSEANGTVNFRYTVVELMDTYYVALDAALINSPPIAPVRAPKDYRLTFRTPEGCNVSDCTSFVGIDTNTANSAFLDIYLEGEAMGWVAVGFSETRSMFSADVVGCYRNPDDESVGVLDTYNVAPPGRNNIADTSQDVVLFNSSFIDGRIICTVAKEIALTDPAPQDLDLNAFLYIFWGRRRDAESAPITQLNGYDSGPGVNPEITPVPYNPSTGAKLTATVRDPVVYQLTFRTPDNCTLSNCTSFVGININNASAEFLDIYMEGEALGWVAVGFSETRDMFSADVVACNRDPATNMVEVLDTYNVPSPNRGNNVDASQDVVLFNSSFDGTRIYCTVAKRIALRDESPRDIDLSSNVYVMWGVRPNDSVQGELQPHASQQPSDIPAISQARFNLITGDMIQLQTPVIAALDYRLRFVDPSGCDPSSCDIFVGIQTNAGNPNFLDIYIEGSSDGWVAVGFSDSRDMLAADVVGCSREASTDIVAVVDTWNNAGERFNELDSEQNVVLFNSSFSNGRISCSVAKQIAPAGTDEDLNLNTPLYVMYGVASGRSGASAALGAHATGGGNPSLSQERFNPAIDSAEVGEDFPMSALLRAHGIIMLIAWPLLAVSGIFFAAWMRPALPNGEWFQIHRAFLLASLFVGALGFILAFVAHAENPTPGLITLGSDNSVGTAHYAIGIIVMLFHIINPLIAIIRCNPGDKKRWIFNLIHGTTIGLLVELFALINIALGLYQFASTSFFEDRTIFWVYIGYFIFLLALIGVLFVVFTLLSLFSQDENRAKTAPSMIKPLIKAPSGKQSPGEGVEMAVPGQKPSAQDDGPPKPKLPSKDAPLRWGALTVFLVVNIVMMLVLIILIAIE